MKISKEEMKRIELDLYLSSIITLFLIVFGLISYFYLELTNLSLFFLFFTGYSIGRIVLLLKLCKNVY